MLTKKQYEVLNFINQKLKDDGFAPSYDEIGEAVGLKAKSNVHRLISALEERGFVRRIPHRARAIEVIRLQENTFVGPA